jgi:hypothetical protein
MAIGRSGGLGGGARTVSQAHPRDRREIASIVAAQQQRRQARQAIEAASRPR